MARNPRGEKDPRRPPLPRFSCYLLALLLLWPALAWAQESKTAPARTPPAKSILLLYSAGDYLPAYRKNISAFYSVMEKAGFPVNRLHFEYLDLIRHHGPDYRRRLLEVLRGKYANGKIDLIISVEGLARDFILNEGADLLPETPLLAILSADALAAVESPRRIVQIPSDLDMAGTLKVGLSLFPGAKRVFVVLGVGDDEQRWERDARNDFEPWAGKLEFEYSSSLTYEETLARIGSLPPETLVIYIALYKDKTGRAFVPRDVATALTAKSNVPVLGVYDEITPLLVGGSMISYGAEGARAARLALDILDGKLSLDQPLATLPILTTPNFNWKQLERWGVSDRKLPAGSIVINRLSSIWDDYKAHVIIALILLALQAGTIIALLAMRRREKKAVSERRRAEEGYRLIVDTANEGVWTIDQTLRTSFVNRKMADMLGYAPEEMLGQPYEQFLHPEDVQAFRSSMDKRRHGQAETYERRVAHKDGRVIWALVNASPINDEHGNFTGSFAMYTDITERKKTEAALRKSEERYRQLVDNANEAIVVLREGLIVFHNPVATAMAGYSQEEYMGAPFARFVHPLDREMVQKRHAQRLSGIPVPSLYDVRIVPKHGGIMWLRVNVVGIQWEGKPATLCFMTDITEQNRAERELRASEEKFRLLFDSAADAIFIHDLEGRFLAVNETACLRLGYDRAEMLNMSVRDIDEPISAELFHAHTEELMTTGQIIREVVHLTKKGEKFPVELHARLLTMEGRRVVLTVARDISERRRMEEALRHSEWFNRSLVEHIPQRIFLKDLESTYISCNDKFAQDLGIEPEEIAGKTDFDFFPREMAEKFRTDDRTVMDGGAAITVEEGYKLGEETRWARTTKVPFRETGGRVIGVLGIFDDVTERRRADEALRDSEQRLRNLADNLNSAMVYQLIGTPDGKRRFTYVSRGVERLNETTVEKVLADAGEIYGQVLPEYVQMVKEREEEARESRGIFRVEVQSRLPSGRLRWFEFTSTPRWQADGQLVWDGVELDITERKLAEEALRQSEHMLRRAQEIAHLGHWKFDPVTNAVEGSDELFRIFGLGREDFALERFISVIVPEQRELVHSSLDRALSQGVGYELGLWLHCPDGARKFIRAIGEPVLDEAGRVVSMVGTVQDITQRKLAEEALEKRLIALSRPLDDVEGIDFHDLFNLEDIQRIQDLFAKATGVASIITLPDGTPITRASNFCRLCSGIIRNTDLGLRNCYASDAVLGRHHPQGPIIQPCLSGGLWDAGASITVGGKHVANWLIGQVRNEKQDERSMRDYARAIGADEEEFMAAFLEVPTMSENQFRLVAEALFALAYQLSTVAYQNVQQARFITERKRAEEDKARLEAQLRQAQKMEAIGTLAGGIAHDFNNILGAVLGFAEMAHDDALSGQVDPADLEQIMASAGRAKELVKQILAFSRKQEPDLKPLSLNQVAQNVRAILGRTLPKMIAIHVDLAENLPPIMADPTQMEQVLLNLASNAADAMPEGGRLTLSTQKVVLDHQYCMTHLEVRPGTYIRLTVADSGQGMDEQTREHIFEPFFTTKEIGKGTGLGLSSVYGIVKAHGGHIQCQSDPGSGTTFTVDLPALGGVEHRPDDEEPAPNPSAPVRSAFILIVDDEEPLLRLGERILTIHGHRVATARSGEEAVEAYRARGGELDLVVMDLSMPGMGGFKALREILALDPKAKVVIASGYAAQGQADRSLASGAAGYVAKPFRAEDLLAAVNKALAPR